MSFIYDEVLKPETQLLMKGISSFLFDFMVSVKYIFSDFKRRPRNFLIAFTSILMVVMFTIVLQNALQKSSLVFLKLAENQVGEYDMVFTASPKIPAELIDLLRNTSNTSLPISPSAANERLNKFQSVLQNSNFLVNQTHIDEKLKGLSIVQGTVGRWFGLGRIKNTDSQNDTSAIILVLDEEKEKNIGMGRSWKKPFLKDGECYISLPLMKMLKLQPKQKTVVSINFLSNLVAFPGFKNTSSAVIHTVIRQLLTSSVNMTVAQVLSILISNSSAVRIPDQFASMTIGELIKEEGLAPLTEQIYTIVFPILTRALDSISVELTIADSVADPKGKWPAALGNVVVLDTKYVKKLLLGFLENNLALQRLVSTYFGISATKLASYFNQIRLEDYSYITIVSFKERFSLYSLSTEDMETRLMSYTNAISDAVGINFPAAVTLPIAKSLNDAYFIKLFLDQIFVSVIVILVLLGMLLIYSLLLSDVEDKTYEFGMLRALGMKTDSLVVLLCIQSGCYALPSILVGLLLSFFINIPASMFIASYSETETDFKLYGYPILIGSLLGLIMPFFANIFPIQRALSRTLRDSLDLYHQVFNETNVKIIKLENLGLSLSQTVVSLGLVVVGFVVYYLTPLSFMFNRLGIFLGILNFILLGMLIGTACIATAIQPIMEKFTLQLLLWGRERRLETLIRKSLSGHRRRNSKTALMFTISLAFIIFAGSMFQLQSNSLKDNLEVGLGSDILLWALNYDIPLDENKMREFLNNDLKRGKNSFVLNFAFITYALSADPFIESTSISNLAGYPSLKTRLFGVDRSFMKSSYNSFCVVKEVDEALSYQTNGCKDVIRSLYDDAGNARLPQEKNGIIVPPYIISNTAEDPVSDNRIRESNETYHNYVDVVVSEALRYTSSIDVHTPLYLEIKVRLSRFSTNGIRYLAKTRAMVSKIPGFFFSSYRQTAFISPVLISMNSFHKLYSDIRQDFFWSNPNIPSTPKKQRLAVKLRNPESEEEKDYIINGLKNFVTSDTILVFDIIDIVNSASVAINLLMLLFDIVATISICLCFFGLWLSFDANVRENSWEYGVLRAIGLSTFEVLRVYVYEALAVILTSVYLATIIGITIAVSLTLQFNLFVEMPFSFAFPYALFCFTVLMSITVAIVGSYIPCRNMNRLTISSSLKGHSA